MEGLSFKAVCFITEHSELVETIIEEWASQRNRPLGVSPNWGRGWTLCLRVNIRSSTGVPYRDEVFAYIVAEAARRSPDGRW